MFHKAGEQLLPMNLSAARKQDYVFELTDRRLVFRTPYGQPEAFSTEVGGCQKFIKSKVFQHSQNLI